MKTILRYLGYAVVVVGVVGVMIYLGGRQDDYAINGDIPAITANDWQKGDAHAPIRLVEYSDFQCPSCAAVHPIVKQALEGEGSRVVFIYRNFPIREKHKNADLAAQIVAAAGRQGKFWEMHDAAFEHQDAWAESADARTLLEGYFTDIGGDVAQLEKDLADNTILEQIKNKIDEDLQGGIDAGVNGTPTFFVNGRAIETPTSAAAWKAVFDSYTKNS